MYVILLGDFFDLIFQSEPSPLFQVSFDVSRLLPQLVPTQVRLNLMHRDINIFGHRVFLSEKLLYKLIFLLFLFMSLLLHLDCIHILLFPLFLFSLLSDAWGLLRYSILASDPEIQVMRVSRGNESVVTGGEGRQRGVARMLQDEIGVSHGKVVIRGFTCGWGN
jgi:hypothetical protein